MVLSIPSLRRVMVVCWNDFFYSLTRLKGLIFIVPFFLFWSWILDKFQQGAAVWLEKPEGIALATWMFNPEQALSLFKTHPPTLSVFLLIALYTLPEFAMLGSYGQLASDAGRGYFRFLLSRCTRSEIFIGRFLSAFFLVSVSMIIIGVAVTWVSLTVDSRETTDIIGYALHVNFVLVLYALPFVLLMTLMGSIFSSGRACLFATFLLFVATKIVAFFARLQWPDMDYIDFALPSRLSSLLVNSAAAAVELKAILALPIYAVVYGLCAWFMFNRRNL